MSSDFSSLRTKFDDYKNYNFNDFITEYASEIESEAPSWIVALASEKFSQQNFQLLRRLAFFIFVERSTQHHNPKEKKNFKLTETLKNFQELIYRFYVYVVLKVPFARWQHLAEETCTLLINSEGNLIDNDEKKELINKLNALERKIADEEEYVQLYCDYLNGAL
ncbi:MAG: hypothetical protein ACFE96_10120 [Candidatus Hermodarchaeota archaeon]